MSQIDCCAQIDFSAQIDCSAQIDGSAQIDFCGGGQSPGKAFAGQAGSDWTEGGSSGRAAQLRPQSGADLGKPEESRRPQPSDG